MRDDFIKQVKDTLSKRAALRCSNPECRMLTVGPNSLENKSTNIGVAAHVTAASKGGPRFDPSLSQEIRTSIANAIWLCQSCAKLIDTDHTEYSVEVLNLWKVNCEKEASQMLNKQNHDQRSARIGKVMTLLPELLNEMKQDLKDNPLLREFVLLKRSWQYNAGKQTLCYYYDDHDNLDAKILLLQNNSFVRDITHNNTRRYVFEETFVDQILKFRIQ